MWIYVTVNMIESFLPLRHKPQTIQKRKACFFFLFIISKGTIEHQSSNVQQSEVKNKSKCLL